MTDPGLQPQRTALAWSRTALALFINAVVILRAGAVHDDRPITTLGILLLIASAATAACGTWRRRRLIRARQPLAPPAWLMCAMVLVVWGACLAGVASLWLSSARA
ncbi:MAG TPA: DUF202 domain-containing protein [Burkholderiaceae bacterium]|nr:DUF202 domain-containing protein [Burkholderiaceae bacterium]